VNAFSELQIAIDILNKNVKSVFNFISHDFNNKFKNHGKNLVCSNAEYLVKHFKNYYISKYEFRNIEIPRLYLEN